MTVPILCLACLFFLIWILILKSELDHKQKELDQVKMLLKKKLGHLENDVKVEERRSLKGSEASSALLRFP